MTGRYTSNLNKILRSYYECYNHIMIIIYYECYDNIMIIIYYARRELHHLFPLIKNSMQSLKDFCHYLWPKESKKSFMDGLLQAVDCIFCYFFFFSIAAVPNGTC